jgi:hypothetical protein
MKMFKANVDCLGCISGISFQYLLNLFLFMMTNLYFLGDPIFCLFSSFYLSFFFYYFIIIIILLNINYYDNFDQSSVKSRVRVLQVYFIGQDPIHRRVHRVLVFVEFS